MFSFLIVPTLKKFFLSSYLILLQNDVVWRYKTLLLRHVFGELMQNPGLVRSTCEEIKHHFILEVIHIIKVPRGL